MANFKGYGGDDLPDPKEIVNRLRSSGGLVGLLVIGVAVVFLGAHSYFTVEADERAIVLRFGKPLAMEYPPGLHFKIPVIDEVFKTQTTRIRQLEFGFRTERAAAQSAIDERFRPEGLMLTGDLELVNVQWTVLYRVSDPQAFLFNVRGVEETIRDISESVVRLLVGDRSSEEVMTSSREEVALLARERIQESLNACSSGVHVESVALRQVEPPGAAQEAFNRVNEARARKQQQIELAKREQEARVSPMRGMRDAQIAEARGRRDRTIMEAEGEALRFRAILAEFNQHPEVTRNWLYLQSMQRVLQKVGTKVLVSEAQDGGATLRLLPLASFAPLGDAAQTPRAPRDEDLPAVFGGGASGGTGAIAPPPAAEANTDSRPTP